MEANDERRDGVPVPIVNPLRPQTLRKKTPSVFALLKSLDPAKQARVRTQNGSENSAESVGSPREKAKTKGWFRRLGRGGKDKDKENERERADRVARDVREAHELEQLRGQWDEENELTRKIGFLTATASENWTLMLDVCNHASATEAYAEEAVNALWGDLKHGEPAAQLAAARLWAIMLPNSSETFIMQSTQRKFEDLLTSSRTSPMVRERVMDVLAAVASASRSKKDVGFRAEEVMRLFTQCAIGVENANLLSEALAMATPEKLSDTVITEFHKKCIKSRELIFTQIPRAFASAEGSRAAKDQEERELARTRKTSADTLASINGSENGNGSLPDLATPVSTCEEELLEELLVANEQLRKALKVYDYFEAGGAGAGGGVGGR
ncbi:hypothetical protein K438DRAFT_1134098 [Mycena galopus ATCC 62051]|nr:hypothetical protein K438DRAFT_1134098 [Mycena galopus ATCC 62051]